MRGNKKKLFIILGASKGLGEAIYRHAASFKENEFVVVGRSKPAALASKTRFVFCDLSEQVKNTVLNKIFFGVKRESDRFKSIYLINNAGVEWPLGPVGKIDNKKLYKAWHINVLNYFIIINEFIKRAHKIKSADKKILSISSGAASSFLHGAASYSAAKAALEVFSACVFEEQKNLKQVKILAFRPGVVDTSMQERIRRVSTKDFPRVSLHKKFHKEKMLRSPEEVAEKIYTVLKNNRYWSIPVLDIKEI